MAKETTTSEFDQMFADLITNPAKESPIVATTPDSPPFHRPGAFLPIPQLAAVESVVVEEKVIDEVPVEKPAAKGYRPAVEKVAVSFPGFPFEMNIAKEKGYLNILFSKFSKSFLYYAQIEKFVRFCQAHGDEFLAYLKSQGVK